MAGKTSLETRLGNILRADPIVWPALVSAQTLDLPDWWIVSGAIYNTVWNALDGHPSGHGIKDIDLFYFDLDTSWDAEDRVINRGKPLFAAAPPIEIRNQARVPLWYRDHFGHPTAPYRDCADAIAHFAARTHAVGVRLSPNDDLEICAPYGLEAIFARRMEPNPINLNRATYETKGARLVGLWPSVTVEPWPDITVIPAQPWHDWDALHALVHRAFAGMDGRIDPPSSLHRMTPADLARDAQAGAAFLAHDGRKLTGCVSCQQQPDALAIGKLAVDPERQGLGIGRALITACVAEANARKLPRLRLQTRVELIENHRTFMHLGFTEVARTAHPGYARPTSITMERAP